MMTLTEVEEVLRRDDQQIFGKNAKAEFRRLAKVIHPDLHNGERVKAERLMAELTQRYEAYQKPKTFTITTRKRAYTIDSKSIKGDIANLYPVGENLLKMPRSSADSDLMEREARALARLQKPPDQLTRLKPYALPLVETFKHRDARGVVRRCNVVKNLNNGLDGESGWYSLEEVKREYPDGLAGRDIAWMWRRLLTAVGYTHSCGVIHGAIVPRHVMIHPSMHGVMLVDWCYSSIADDDGNYAPIPAYVPKSDELYPEEVRAKENPIFGTDVYMASATMLALCGSDTPVIFERFAKGSKLGKKSRPQDAFKLVKEFDDLLFNAYGKRTYVPFEMPRKKK